MINIESCSFVAICLHKETIELEKDHYFIETQQLNLNKLQHIFKAIEHCQNNLSNNVTPAIKKEALKKRVVTYL